MTKHAFKPIPGAGIAGFANNYCHAKTADGKQCRAKALRGGYYCKAHVPK